MSPRSSGPDREELLKTTFFQEFFVWVAHPSNVNVGIRDVTHGDGIFVCGKLMDPEFIREITGRYIPFTAAVARNYARGERGRGPKKTLLLEPAAGKIVLGALLLKLEQADKEALERFEQVPDVRRKVSICITAGALARPATTFLLNE
jgi:hypothetical protein